MATQVEHTHAHTHVHTHVHTHEHGHAGGVVTTTAYEHTHSHEHSHSHVHAGAKNQSTRTSIRLRSCTLMPLPNTKSNCTSIRTVEGGRNPFLSRCTARDVIWSSCWPVGRRRKMNMKTIVDGELCLGCGVWRQRAPTFFRWGTPTTRPQSSLDPVPPSPSRKLPGSGSLRPEEAIKIEE